MSITLHGVPLVAKHVATWLTSTTIKKLSANDLERINHHPRYRWYGRIIQHCYHLAALKPYHL